MSEYSQPGLSPTALLPGESMREAEGYPALTYFRKGSRDQPLLVFLPGGGHLARIAYGHPACRGEDFLDHWLAREGFGLLAISYPSDHPVYERIYPAMTVTEWGAFTAGITRQLIDEHGLSNRVVLAGWSMAGRAGRPFNKAASQLGLEVEAFLSLAATPPLFLHTEVEEAFWQTRDGLRETRHPQPGLEGGTPWWDIALAEQAQLNGRPIIASELYFEAFRGNHPANLNGQRLRYRDGAVVLDLAEATEDMGGFDYASFPLTACLVPQSETDLRHAVTDNATWDFINAQKLLCTWLQPLMALYPERFSAHWPEIRQLIDTELHGLSHSVPGGHLFFIGALGAERVAAQIAPLLSKIAALRARLEAFAQTIPLSSTGR